MKEQKREFITRLKSQLQAMLEMVEAMHKQDKKIESESQTDKEAEGEESETDTLNNTESKE
jgi:hypothetical protein